jgi:hypothetical protein
MPIIGWSDEDIPFNALVSVEIYGVMPSGIKYHQREIAAAEKWWFDMVATARWWMATQVYPTNPVASRVRAAIGPVDESGIPFAIVAFGSTEVEAKIHVMRQVAKITQ